MSMSCIIYQCLVIIYCTTIQDIDICRCNDDTNVTEAKI